MKKLITIFLTIILLLTLIPASPVSAVDFTNQIDILYTVNSDGTMHITETKTITNKSAKYYITEESFFISPFKTRAETTQADLEKIANTITIKDGSGNKLSVEPIIHDSKIEVKIEIGANFSKGETRKFILEYDNFELASKSGNVWNIYIPAMPSNYNEIVTWDVGATSKNDYSVSLKLDKSLGNTNFVLPEPKSTTKKDGEIYYNFSVDSLVDKYAWIQIGSKQYYSFQIKQPVKSSPELGVFNVIYDLVLPRDSDNQKVYFDSIQPAPKYIREDGEGNVIARFEFENDEDSEIVVDGFIEARITEKIDRDEVGAIDDIDYMKKYATIDEQDVMFSDLLSQSEYWEVEASQIKQKANELKGDKENVYDILLADYNFIIENVDYDNLKIGIKNQRQGALETLRGGSSVCMEYSDLLITLLRAQGIPARAAFGYGFDPKSEDQSTEGHQWVEVYMPNVGWVTVDPTWGDTGRKSYIGGDVDHALWRVASQNVQTPSPVTKYSIMDNSELEPPEFTFNVEESISKTDLSDLDELLADYPYTKKHTVIEKVNQLNIYGKVIFLGVPTLLLLLLSIIILTTIVKLLKKLFGRNFVHAKPAGHDVPPDNPYYE